MDVLLKRISLLVELASRRRETDARLGKTAAQKLIYLLQEVYRVPLEYRFSLYTYGPYTPEIMNDIDYAESVGVISVSHDRDRGYNLVVGENADKVEEHCDQLRKEYREQLDLLFQMFGEMTAKQLELRATLVYVKKTNSDFTRDQIVSVVSDIKPVFDRMEIEAAYQELVQAKVFDMLDSTCAKECFAG